MEQKDVAMTMEEFKERLAHTKGGSIYISKEVGEELLKLNGRDMDRLSDELIFRRVRIIKKKNI